MALHQSGEDYLEAILMLQKEKGMVRSVDAVSYTHLFPCLSIISLPHDLFLQIIQEVQQVS